MSDKLEKRVCIFKERMPFDTCVDCPGNAYTCQNFLSNPSQQSHIKKPKKDSADPPVETDYTVRKFGYKWD